MIAALIAGCQDDGLNPPPLVPESELYWALDLNHHAVLMSSAAAPYDTLTLAATPRRADGAALSGLPAPQFVSRDPERVAVTPEGRLVAVAPTSGSQVVAVVATLTAGNLKHVDSVLVKVVDNPTPPVLTAFSIHPVPPDSAKAGSSNSENRNPSTTCFKLPALTRIPAGCKILLPVRVLDADGQPIAGALVSLRSSDPALVGVDDRGIIFTSAWTGTTTFYASTTVFGIVKADTLPFRIGRPVDIEILVSQLQDHTFPPDIQLGVGGSVAWGDVDLAPGPIVDITFSDPTNVAALDPAQPPSFMGSTHYFFCQIFCGGEGSFVLNDNFSQIPGSGAVIAFRRFPVPGIYEYHSAALGIRGRIVVAEDAP